MFYLGSMDTSHKVDRVVKARRGMSIDISSLMFGPG
jgi:hypothetical protein